MKATIRTLGKLIGGKTAFVLLLCASAVAARAQTFTTLYSFNISDGEYPEAGVIQAGNGDFYGTTSFGGANPCPVNQAGALGCGTIFKVTATGGLTTLYSFCSQAECSDGGTPWSGLIQSADGNFYGTTVAGGNGVVANSFGGYGTVFKISPTGTFTTLYRFCAQIGCPDGYGPYATLVEGTDGDFYGTTFAGGAHDCGTVFKITSGGSLTTLYSFCTQANGADGINPYGGLVLAANGDFYGTTTRGGAVENTYECWVLTPVGCGTIFKITPGAKLTTLHVFCRDSVPCADGAFLENPLIQATDGNLYGTTGSTYFDMTRGGKLTTLSTLSPYSGNSDYSGLVQGTDGNFYGISSNGEVFEMTPDGALTTLYSVFGYGSFAAVLLGTNGDLYGTTYEGGTYGYGSVFSFSTGLGPFVRTHQTSGKAGALVEILGTNLTGATSVTFNGTPSPFSVSSSSLIVTTVPPGATSGTIEVVTPSGTLSSYPPFTVLP